MKYIQICFNNLRQDRSSRTQVFLLIQVNYFQQVDDILPTTSITSATFPFYLFVCLFDYLINGSPFTTFVCVAMSFYNPWLLAIGLVPGAPQHLLVSLMLVRL